jgi:hypothetical protein
MLKLFVLLALSFSIQALASTRAIFLPDGSLILMLQGTSETLQPDPDPRALFDSIGEPVQNESGNSGKTIATSANDFVLSCATNNGVTHTYDCTIHLGASSATQISFMNQTAHMKVNGAEAEKLHQKFAGPGSSAFYQWQSANSAIHITSSPEEFRFDYKTAP